MPLTLQKPEYDLLVGSTPAQKEFWEDPHKNKILAKGRRFGATRSAANYIIKRMLKEPGLPVLWVDVIYGNINRYYSRYFVPVLTQLPRGIWSWKKQEKLLQIGESILDFRSADRPESLEGFGYRIIVLNEAGIILRDRNLWDISIAPMCLDYDPEVFFLGTPKGTLDKNGEESLYFELYKRGCNPDEPLWQSYQFSTHDNPLLKKETIDELESRTPPLIRLQEIEGEFINISEHRVFDEAWFSIVHDYEMPVDSAFIVKIMSLDTAFKKNDDSDFSACVCIYQTYDTYYVVDVVNDKYEFPELIKAVDGIYERHRPDAVLIEDRASGQSLIQTLRRETTYPVRAISPDKDKITRAHAVTPLCEARKVKLLEGAWNRKFLDQLSYFPDGSDDIVDAFSQAMTYLKTYRGGAKAGVTSYNTTAQTHQSINLRGYNDPYGQT